MRTSLGLSNETLLRGTFLAILLGLSAAAIATSKNLYGFDVSMGSLAGLFW